MAEYLIGFDRFVALEWANYALALSSSVDSEAAKVVQLKSWLSSRVSGDVAIRKTANVLSRLWIDTNSERVHFRNEARKVALTARKEDRLVLHWGMALLTFPFFRETCTQIGRLLSLQPTFTRHEIHIRMAEKYSNRETVHRSINWILQSLVDWKLLAKVSSQELEGRPYKTSDILVKKWLLETVVFSAPQKRIPMDSFYKLPELFAFEFNGDSAQIANDSAKIKIERDGGNLEYVVWHG